MRRRSKGGPEPLRPGDMITARPVVDGRELLDLHAGVVTAAGVPGRPMDDSRVTVWFPGLGPITAGGGPLQPVLRSEATRTGWFTGQSRAWQHEAWRQVARLVWPEVVPFRDKLSEHLGNL